jgi:hypothetical protein
VRRFDHVVLDVGPESVLRAENGGQIDAGRLDQPIDDVAVGMVDRCVVADDADTGAAQMLGSDENVGTQAH